MQFLRSFCDQLKANGLIRWHSIAHTIRPFWALYDIENASENERQNVR